jgi:hypothetical protein
MMFQRIEVLLDMQAKKITAELSKLREELSQAKEDLRKELHAAKQDSSQATGGAHVQMYADVPPQQQQQPVPRYAQEGYAQQPQYAQGGPQGYAQGYGQPQSFAQQAPQGYAQQQASQGQPQQAPQGTWNQPFPPQMRGGDKVPETKPIDRNGVAPSDVSVEKFFYMGNKKK